MRAVILVLSFAALCGSAESSSFVTLGSGPGATPSIVAIGTPQSVAASPQERPDQPSPSVAVLGMPATGVSGDTVAAIPKTAAPRLAPMVIRAGIVDSMSPVPVPAATAAAGSQAPASGNAAPASGNAAPSAGADAGIAPGVKAQR